jgi:hypothetical protein
MKGPRICALRRSGRRFHDRGQECVRGELLLHSIMRGHETHRVAQLRAQDARGSRSDDVLPPLYHPELVAVGNGALLLRWLRIGGRRRLRSGVALRGRERLIDIRDQVVDVLHAYR